MGIRSKRKECIECHALVFKLQGHGLCQRCYRYQYVLFKRSGSELTFSNWRRNKIGLSITVMDDIPAGIKSKKKVKSREQKWVDKLDSVFSIFIRLRDTDVNGVGKSIDDGRRIYFFLDSDGTVVTNCDNGHYLRRGLYSTRWNEMNCNAQSISTNRFKEGEKVKYRVGLKNKYGIGKLTELEKLEHIVKKRPSAFEMEAKYKYYQKEVERLINTKKWYSEQRTARSLYK